MRETGLVGTSRSGDTRRTPVIVIGAGPVGQTTALLLARWGVPVLLLDARAARDPVGSKAICQQRDVLDVWESVGVGERLARRGVTWTTARTFHRERELFSWTFVDRGRSPFPPFVNVSQQETEELLDERIAREPRVSIRWNHRVTDISQDNDGVQLECVADGVSLTIGASHVVVCAGARGDDLRRNLDLTFEGESYDDHFLICDIRAELPEWLHERRFYFDPPWNPGRQVLIHPCPDSTFRIDWQVPHEFDLAEEEANGGLHHRIEQVIGARPYQIRWKSVYRFHSRVVDRMRVGRVLVAGDAAHLVSPFGARGLNSGVFDAENAAWKIAFVRNSWAPDTLLESYHDERHAAALENIAVTDATMRFFIPRTPSETRDRLETLERAARDSAVHADVDSGRLAEPFWYVESPLTTPDPLRPFGGRPARADVPRPAPGVLVPDCPVVVSHRPDLRRLRQLAREGVTVLVGDNVQLPERYAELSQRTPGVPIAVYRMHELDDSSFLAEALGAGPNECWVLRPDGYVAAVTRDAHSIRAVIERLLGNPSTSTLPSSGLDVIVR